MPTGSEIDRSPPPSFPSVEKQRRYDRGRLRRITVPFACGTCASVSVRFHCLERPAASGDGVCGGADDGTSSCATAGAHETGARGGEPRDVEAGWRARVRSTRSVSVGGGPRPSLSSPAGRRAAPRRAPPPPCAVSKRHDRGGQREFSVREPRVRDTTTDRAGPRRFDRCHRFVSNRTNERRRPTAGTIEPMTFRFNYGSRVVRRVLPRIRVSEKKFKTPTITGVFIFHGY